MAWCEDYKFTPVHYAFNDLYNALKERDFSGERLDEKPSAFSKCYLAFIDNQLDKITGAVLYTVPADNTSGETTNYGGFIDISTIPSQENKYYYFNSLLKQVAGDAAIAQKRININREPFYSLAWLEQRKAMINLLRYFQPAEITYNVTFYKYKMWFRFSGSKFIISATDVLEDGDETLVTQYAYTSIEIYGKVATATLSKASKREPSWTDPEFEMTILIPKNVTITTCTPALPSGIFAAYVENNSNYTGYVTNSKPSNTYGVYNFPLPFSLDTENPYISFNNSGVFEFDAYKKTANAIIEFLYTLTSQYDIACLNVSLKVKLDSPYLDLHDAFEYK